MSRFFSHDSRWLGWLVCGACSMMLLGCAPPTKYAGDGTDHANEPPPTPIAASPRPASSADASEAVPAEAPRSRALLITEVQELERLAAVTPKNAPDHPQLLMRLGEDYAELERADATAGDKTAERNARAKAIEKYAQLVSEHPDFPQLDEALFYLANEFQQSGDLANARRNYVRLIQRAPRSRFVPNVYLAFGEMFFDEAANDPSKYELAATAYREAMKLPPPQNKVYGYAAYKLGWSLFDSGKSDEAVEAFQRVLDYLTKYPNVSGAKQLHEAARKDLARLQSQQIP